MKESIYNIWLDNLSDKSNKLCYNTSTGGFCEIDSNSYKFLQRILSGEIDESSMSEENQKLFNAFIKGRIIVKDDVDETERLRFGYRKSTYSRNTLSLTILPTLNCNCNCVYCFENKNQSKMSKEVIEKIKDKITREVETNKVKHVGITWFGGEPLMEFGIIKDISDHVVDFCDKNKIGYSFSVISNALLITKEMCEYFKKIRLRRLQVTIDGPRRIHDKRRILSGGQGTFDKILAKIEMASEYIRVNVRVNVDKKISESLPELFEDLKPISNLKNVTIYPAQLQDEMTSACASVETSCFNLEEFAKHAKKFVIEAHKTGFPFFWQPSPKSSCCCATGIIIYGDSAKR